MNKVFIIAEAGVNHNGSIELAKKLIDVAVEAKVDAVKFQTFKAENLVSKNAQKADYQKQTTDKEESQFDMIKNYNNLVSLCGGQGYSFEKVLYTEMEEANYAIKLVPTIDSYNYIYIYRKGDK